MEEENIDGVKKGGKKKPKKGDGKKKPKKGANEIEDVDENELEQTTYDTDRVEVVSDSIIDTLDRDLHTRNTSKVEPGTTNDVPSIPTLRGDVCATSASASIECTVSKFRDPKYIYQLGLIRG